VLPLVAKQKEDYERRLAELGGLGAAGR
jgi:hypothetical protein